MSDDDFEIVLTLVFANTTQ